jgi:hypothetical protein
MQRLHSFFFIFFLMRKNRSSVLDHFDDRVNIAHPEILNETDFATSHSSEFVDLYDDLTSNNRNSGIIAHRQCDVTFCCVTSRRRWDIKRHRTSFKDNRIVNFGRYHVQRVSAKHGVKDDFAFLWEHAIFRHPPNKNPLTDRSEILQN